jgi:chaperonin GroES
MNIRPLGDKLIVKYVVPKDRTDAGIIIPGAAKARPTEAEVIAVGPGRILGNGKRNIMPAKVGDKALVSFSGQELESQDENLRIIDAGDVLAIMK